MSKVQNKIQIVKNVTLYSTYLIVFWAFYRFLFQLPDNVTELVVKPVVWLLPLFFVLNKERSTISSLGVTFRNLFPSIYLSLGLGAFFLFEAVLTNYLKYGGLSFNANIGTGALMPSLGLSFATALSEETAFRGYIFNRLQLVFGHEIGANIVQSILWMGVHIPVAFFVYKMDVSTALVYLLITTIFGMGSAYIFSRTKNIFGSILLHVLWEWPIILFR